MSGSFSKGSAPDNVVHEEIKRPGSLEKGDADQRTESDVKAEEPYHFTQGKLLAIIGLWISYLADIFNEVMCQNAQTRINAEIGPVKYSAWVGLMVLYTCAIPSPLVGYLSDLYGRRYFILVGSILGLIGNVAAANVNNIVYVIGVSAITGIGAALHQLAIPALAEIVPRRHRPLAFGSFYAAMAPASAFGPVIASSILNHDSWRAIYWIPFALNILAFFLVLFFYHPVNDYVREKGMSLVQQLLYLDWVGILAVVGGSAVGILGVAFGLFNYPWHDSRTLGCLVVGITILVGTIPLEYIVRKRLPRPMFPASVYGKYRQYTVFLPPILLCGLVFSATSTLWPQQVQLLYTQDPIKAGWYISAPPLTGILFAPLYGWILQRFSRHTRWILTFLVGVLTLFSGLQAVITPGSHGVSTFLVCIMGLAYTGLVVGFTSAIQFVPHGYLATSTSYANWLRVIGSAAGILSYSLILDNRLQGFILKDVAVPLAEAGVDPTLIPEVIQALTSGATTSPVLASIPLTTLGLAVAGLKSAFASTFKIAYYSTIAFGVPSMLLIALSKNFDHEMTPDVDVTLVEGFHIRPRPNASRGPISQQQSFNGT